LAIAIVNDFFKLLKNFDKEKILLEYKSRSLVLGKKILLYGTAFGQLPENDGKGTLARAVDIDENGGLIVEYLEGHRFGEIDSITSGEVTLREVT
jgi:BirA family biotin operon repressor/biotin-[acetyl-CoA-carboxylase] ligase